MEENVADHHTKSSLSGYTLWTYAYDRNEISILVGVMS